MKNSHPLLKGLAALTAATIMLTSCVEEIDQSNRYTFLGETVGSFLENHDEVYSDFNYVLNRSGVMSLLKAYGTYTCFAPTNEALKRFLIEQDSIYQASLLPDSKKIIWTGITSPNLEDLSDSMCTVISNSHVLPATILTTEMEGDVLPARNLNDRYLTMTYGVDDQLQSVLYVNGSEIISSDEEVENGVIHTVSKVLNPSTNTVPTQIKDMPFLSIFSEAMEMTGLEDKMQLYRDESYTDGDKFADKADMGANPMPYPPAAISDTPPSASPTMCSAIWESSPSTTFISSASCGTRMPPIQTSSTRTMRSTSLWHIICSTITSCTRASYSIR